MKICRACLSKDELLIQMNTAFVQMYNNFTNLNIDLMRDGPLYTCKTCLDAVNFCVMFREKCISSDSTFHSTFENKLFPESEVAVSKQELNENDNMSHDIKMERECYNMLDEYFDMYSDDTCKIGIDVIDNNEDPNIKLEKEDDSPKKRKRGRPPKSPNIQKEELNKRKEKVVKVPPKRKKLNVPKSKENIEEHKINNPQIKNNAVNSIVKCDIIKYCGLCTNTFNDMDSLMEHLKSHTQGGCQNCAEMFIDFTHLLSHRVAHLPLHQQRCHICVKYAPTPLSLESHYLKVHKLRGEEEHILCKICLKPFTTPRKLTRHLKATHCENKFQCHDCGKGFRIKSTMRNHIICHHLTFKYKCSHCDYTAKHPASLRAHMLRNHNKSRVQCPVCKTHVRNQEVLEQHNLRCKEKPHIILCPMCGVDVKRTQLKFHLLKHKNRVFNCALCPAQFKSRSSWQAHKNMHDGSRPHKCEYCPMAFRGHPTLIKHRRTHTGEKPYVCQVCEKGFTSNHNLKVHMRVHGISNLVVKKGSLNHENL